MDQKTKKIIANFFDFDHSLFNPAYHALKDKNVGSHAVLEANKIFLNDLINFCLKVGFTHDLIVYNGVFSNRQSNEIDRYNSQEYKTESCFLAMQKVQDYLENQLSMKNIKTILDPYLLSDTFHDLNIGDTFFQKAFREENHVFDESKLSLVYARTHRLASLPGNAEVPILCRFSDDSLLILGNLLKFLRVNSHWIHKNTTVQFIKYLGKKLFLVGEVVGTGIEIDFDYQNSVKKMCCLGFGFVQKKIPLINLVECFSKHPDKVKHFDAIKTSDIKLIYPEDNMTLGVEDKMLKEFCKKRSHVLKWQRCFSQESEENFEVHLDSPLLKVKSYFFGHSLFHLTALLGDIEAIVFFLRQGINPDLVKNCFDEKPSDLADEFSKSWFSIPTSDTFPARIHRKVDRKRYIEIKIDFHLANLHGQEFIWFIAVKEAIKIDDMGLLQNLQTTHPASIATLKLIEDWIEGNYDEDTESCHTEETESFNSDSSEEGESNIQKPQDLIFHMEGVGPEEIGNAAQYGSVWSTDPVEPDQEMRDNAVNTLNLN